MPVSLDRPTVINAYASVERDSKDSWIPLIHADMSVKTTSDTVDELINRVKKLEEERNMNNKETEVFKEGSQTTIHKIVKPIPECITTNGPCTIVKWQDGSITKVKCSENDKTGDGSVYLGFCAALAKKIYANNTCVHKIIDEHTAEYLEAQQAKVRKEKIEANRIEEKRRHAKKVKAMAKRIQLEKEAEMLLLTTPVTPVKAISN